VKVETSWARCCRRSEWGDFSSAHHPARPSGVRREEAACATARTCALVDLLSGVAAAGEKVSARSSSLMVIRHVAWRFARLAKFAVYSDPTNQVPATWFASDAGIRRLASLSDGPVRGRRRVFTLSDISREVPQSVGARSSTWSSVHCSGQLGRVAAAGRPARAAVRSARSASYQCAGDVVVLGHLVAAARQSPTSCW
jgi:hypothetical protein